MCYALIKLRLSIDYDYVSRRFRRTRERRCIAWVAWFAGAAALVEYFSFLPPPLFFLFFFLSVFYFLSFVGFLWKKERDSSDRSRKEEKLGVAVSKRSDAFLLRVFTSGSNLSFRNFFSLFFCFFNLQVSWFPWEANHSKKNSKKLRTAVWTQMDLIFIKKEKKLSTKKYKNSLKK